jgi:hypothetical protein
VPTSSDSGKSAALIAQQDAAAAGMPLTRPIYFSVDGDTSSFTSLQWSPIFAFFTAVNSVLGKNRTGVYGGRHTLEVLRDRGAASWFWQTSSWSDGVWVPFANLRQYDHDLPLCGGAVDLNRSQVADYGQW